MDITSDSHFPLMICKSCETRWGEIFKENINFNAVILINHLHSVTFGPRQANLVLIAYASSEGSGETANPRSLDRTFAARSYKQ